MPAQGMSPTITHRVNTAHPGATLGCRCLWQCLHRMHTHTNQNHHCYSLCEDESAIPRLGADIDLRCRNLIIKIQTVSKTPHHVPACEFHICCLTWIRLYNIMWWFALKWMFRPRAQVAFTQCGIQWISVKEWVRILNCLDCILPVLHGSEFWQNHVLKHENRGNGTQDAIFPKSLYLTQTQALCFSDLCFSLSLLLCLSFSASLVSRLSPFSEQNKT